MQLYLRFLVVYYYWLTLAALWDILNKFQLSFIDDPILICYQFQYKETVLRVILFLFPPCNFIKGTQHFLSFEQFAQLE